MRKILMFFALLLIGAGFTGCAWLKCQPEVDEIVAKVKQKNDPQNKAKTINTTVLRYDYVNESEKAKITILLKRPGKLKIMNRMRRKFWECAFDGKKAWEYSNSRGLRYLTDPECDEVRLQAFLLVPSINIKKVFKDIKLAGSTKVDGQDCWKLICQPADVFKSQTITVFVTKKSSLIVKTIEKHDEEKTLITVVTLFKNYKILEGFLLPTVIVTKVDDDVTISTLVSIALNREIPDSVFAAPKVFK